ncbi:MAG: outer membrane protein assembly factor BamD, partial [Candidatus Omnitrophica bacterium]|nr:outer membrane protein assembly factor BamD [Candidatus Omnitrophota bacterium]
KAELPEESRLVDPENKVKQANRPALMTFGQINRRIDEIPREARPGIEFSVDDTNKRDGLVFIHLEDLKEQEFFISHLVGFTVFDGDVYVMHLNSEGMKQGDYTPDFHRITRSGDRTKLSQEDLPLSVRHNLGIGRPIPIPSTEEKAEEKVTQKARQETDEKQKEAAKKISDAFISEKLASDQKKEEQTEAREQTITKAIQEATATQATDGETPKTEPSFFKSSIDGVLEVGNKTKEFLERILFLRKKTPGQNHSGFEPQTAPYWVWSPSESKFVSTAAVGVAQKSAEEQYQHALKLRETGKPHEVIREFEKVVRYFPQSAYAPEAQFLIAALFEQQDKPLRAAREYQKLIREFPRSERLDAAVANLFKIGNRFLGGEKQKIMGVSIIPVLPKAVDIFRFIIDEAPYGPYGDQAQLALGTAYRKMGNFEEAVKAFEALIENYPSSPLVDEAHYQLAETSYEFSQNANRDQKTLSQASGRLKDFIKQYGSNTLAERAKILKQQLDEQDAEKNYRIGLYYEKQGFIESALIYYEDVSGRYGETVFGRKAAERLQALNQPALAKQKGEAEIERRMAEVRSMFEALDEENERKAAGAQGIQDTAPLRSQLEAELATLDLAKKELREETQEKLHSRKEALRDREKNLREKFKIFASRKKHFREKSSPELEEAFQQWEESLKKEQAELLKERQTVKSLGFELKPEEISWFGWVPFFGKDEVPSREELLRFQDKEWNKLEQERAQVQEKRKIQEKELTEISVRIAELDAREFEMARQAPLFQELLPVELQEKGKAIEEERGKRDQSLRAFEHAKNEYQSQYGNEFTKTLTLESNAKSLRSASELMTSGADLEGTLKKLQTEKASLSLAWLAQKERLSTLVKAFGKTQSPNAPAEEAKVLAPAPEKLTAEGQETAARVLKKRIKYLEREIRSRVDQIDDWQRENTKRTDQLEAILHSKRDASALSQTAGKVFTPAAGIYKLGKAFLFGLPNRDRELLEEAKLKTAGGGTDLGPEELKTVRELEEEIELQSMLIQGRAKEIEEMQNRLAELRKQAVQIPNFSYQTMLIERFPSSLDYSLNSARELLGEENQEAVFQDRLSRQRREIESLEAALNEINQKIETVGIAIERSKPQETAPAAVVTSILGDAETLPSRATESSAEGAEAKTQLESKLVQMKAEMAQAENQFQEEKTAFDLALLKWYQTEAREKILAVFSSDGKSIVDQKESWIQKQQDLQNALTRLVEEEYHIAESQKKFLDQKLAEFEKRLRQLKAPSGSLQKVLDEEMRTTAEMRDALIRDISFLESSLKK